MYKATKVIRGKHRSQALAARHARALARTHPRTTIRVIRRDKRGRFSVRGMQFWTNIIRRKAARKPRVKAPAKPAIISAPKTREYSVTPDYKRHRKRHGGALKIQVHMTVKSAEKPPQEQLQAMFEDWLQGGEPRGVTARIVSWQHGNRPAVEATKPEEAREIFGALDLHVPNVKERK